MLFPQLLSRHARSGRGFFCCLFFVFLDFTPHLLWSHNILSTYIKNQRKYASSTCLSSLTFSTLVNYCNSPTLWILPPTHKLSTLLSFSHFTQACYSHDFYHIPFFPRLIIQTFDSSPYSKFVSDPHVLHIVTCFCF